MGVILRFGAAVYTTRDMMSDELPAVDNHLENIESRVVVAQARPKLSLQQAPAERRG